MASAYDVITDRIIEQLEKGVVPWRKPWGDTGEPANLVSQKPYRGVNWLMLSCARYGSRYWLTFNQAKDLGATIRKGEHGWPVVFCKDVTKPKDEGQSEGEHSTKDHYTVMRYYTVFNVEQTEGFSEKTLAKIRAAEPKNNHDDPVADCEAITAGYGDCPQIEHGKDGAWYSPSTDVIGMPNREKFTSIHEYYSALFHEMAHSTGHGSRLGRFDPTDNHNFGSNAYSKEELIAEVTSAFLCSKGGIVQATLENSAAYCQSWIGRLKGDAKLIVSAAAQAQKAADYILGTSRMEVR